jgi:CBS-domain-containing membrane protein
MATKPDLTNFETWLAHGATDPVGTEAALEHDVDAVLDRLEAGITIERKALDAMLERLTRRAAA